MVHQFPRPFSVEGVLAYLLTVRCYGTWLHGHPRGSMDRAGHNVYGEPVLPADAEMEARDRRLLRYPPMRLSPPMRQTVDNALREVCAQKDWPLYAVNVQTDHAHMVVAAVGGPPEAMLNSLKAWASRRLREAGLVDAKSRVWSRHGSTKYLWVEDQIHHAVAYVEYGQPLPPGI